jgi:pilus assembly protein FimV
MDMPELEPVTMSEVGTKLDLARAYMDMGDPDGARSILEEVLQEGSSSQKQEAERLLDSIR